MADRDIMEIAERLICEYGAIADIEAAKRADMMFTAGDATGAEMWSRILMAVRELQAPEAL